MQTGIISFGDRVAWNIKCNIIKDVILNELLNLFNDSIDHYTRDLSSLQNHLKNI